MQNKKSGNICFKALSEEYARHQALKKQIMSQKKDEDLNLPPSTFFVSMAYLTPQSYGAKIQKYVANRLGMAPVHVQKDQGDWTDSENRFFELKSSLLTDTNAAMNLVQIRKWQNLDGYFALAVDLRDIKPEDENWNKFSERVHVFYLTKEQMLYECDILKAPNAHGTKEATSANANVELRLSINVSETDPIFNRWCDNYKIDNSFLNK